MSFLNIFSKNKESKREGFQVIVDIHEKNSLVPSELAKQGIIVKFESLPIGDYIAGDVAIERKTISDLKSSIINKRMHLQLKSLEQFKKSALVIEGLDSEAYNSEALHENALRGFILSVLLNYKIPIIPSIDEKDTARYLYLLAKKTSNSSLSFRTGKSKLSDQEIIEFIIEGFPEIGPTTSKKLLEKFSTITNLISASEKELHEAIGKKAESIVKLRTLKYKDS